MSRDAMNPQVLVVGAGPVGLTMAAELARNGIAVRIVDKAPERTDKSKPLVLWSRTLELLDRAGASGAFIAAGMKVDTATIVAGGRPIARAGPGGVKSPYPSPLRLPQAQPDTAPEMRLACLSRG